MSVKDYYILHFNDLTPNKQFHFATRMKNWLKTTSFDDYLQQHMPGRSLKELFFNDDFSHVNNLEVRRVFFERYQGLYALEATLFRVYHLLVEYGMDVREDFEILCSRETLYKFCDTLAEDTEALVVLTSYAVNAVCLSEELFPREKDVVAKLGRAILKFPKQDANTIYAYTHLIICDTGFYHREINAKHQSLFKDCLAKCEELLEADFAETSLDTKLEFLVCCRLVDYDSHLRDRIAAECQANLKDSPFVTDYRKADRLNTFDGAEHRNVLYIMSGLDS